MKTWRFEAMDTWFFRESRGHDSVGVSELASIFPPPARTLAGAVRTLVGEAHDVDWQAWRETKGRYEPALNAAIGYGDDLGALSIAGVFPVLENQRLYPWPLNLLTKATSDGAEYARLRLGSTLRTHLGTIRAPDMTQGPGFKVPDNVWLTADGLRRVLDGGLPLVEHIKHGDTLHSAEPRLGIALAHDKRTVQDGMLYQTRHIRPHPKLALEVDIDGLDDLSLPDAGVLRLGGEGRAAGYRVVDSTQNLPAAPQPHADDAGLLLILLAPAKLDGWLPPGFTAEVHDSFTTWHGDIAGVALRIHAAVSGKPLREGGWDMAANAPRAVASLLPAGSLWYCTVEDGDLQSAAARLHGAYIGEETALGRGLLAVARWPASETTE